MSTNDSRRDADYTLTGDAQARAVRRDAEDDQPVKPIAYVPGSQRARAFPGDDKFPFVKDVSDVTGPDEYRKSIQGGSFTNPLPLASDLTGYETLGEVDVRGHRAFCLFGLYTPAFAQQGGGTGLLSLICEASFAPFAPTSYTFDTWVPIGVVNPVLNTPAIAPGYAYREFHSSEFRLNPWTGYQQPPYPNAGTVSFTLVFDVSWYRKVRIRCADLVSDAAYLDLRFFRQR